MIAGIKKSLDKTAEKGEPYWRLIFDVFIMCVLSFVAGLILGRGRFFMEEIKITDWITAVATVGLIIAGRYSYLAANSAAETAKIANKVSLITVKIQVYRAFKGLKAYMDRVGNEPKVTEVDSFLSDFQIAAICFEPALSEKIWEYFVLIKQVASAPLDGHKISEIEKAKALADKLESLLKDDFSLENK